MQGLTFLGHLLHAHTWQNAKHDCNLANAFSMRRFREIYSTRNIINSWHDWSNDSTDALLLLRTYFMLFYFSIKICFNVFVKKGVCFKKTFIIY